MSQSNIVSIPERFMTSDGFLCETMEEAENHENWIPQERFTGFNGGEFATPVNVGGYQVPHQILETFLLQNRDLVERFFNWDENNPGAHKNYLEQYREKLIEIRGASDAQK